MLNVRNSPKDFHNQEFDTYHFFRVIATTLKAAPFQCQKGLKYTEHREVHYHFH